MCVLVVREYVNGYSTNIRIRQKGRNVKEILGKSMKFLALALHATDVLQLNFIAADYQTTRILVLVISAVRKSVLDEEVSETSMIKNFVTIVALLGAHALTNAEAPQYDK